MNWAAWQWVMVVVLGIAAVVLAWYLLFGWRLPWRRRRCVSCGERRLLFSCFSFAGESIVSRVWCELCGAEYDNPDTYGCTLVLKPDSLVKLETEVHQLLDGTP